MNDKIKFRQMFAFRSKFNLRLLIKLYKAPNRLFRGITIAKEPNMRNIFFYETGKESIFCLFNDNVCYHFSI